MKIESKNLKIDFNIKFELPSNLINVNILKEDYNSTLSFNNYSLRSKSDINYSINPKLSGVYFLLNNQKEIIYIGKASNCIRQRILSHLITEPSKYTSERELMKLNLKRQYTKYITYIELNKKDLDLTEILLIKKFKPVYNVQYK